MRSRCSSRRGRYRLVSWDRCLLVEFCPSHRAGNPSVDNRHHSISDLTNALIMRHDDHCLLVVVPELLEQMKYLLARGSVQLSRRLVRKGYGGGVRKGGSIP